MMIVSDWLWSSGGFKGAVGAAPPYWRRIFLISPLFPCKSSVCAFAINDDGADTLFPSPFTIFGSATVVKMRKLTLRILILVLLTGAREGWVGGGVSWPRKIWSWGQKLHMSLTSDRCQSNGNDHLSNNQHDFKGWGEKQRIMLPNFMTLTPPPPVEKWFPSAWLFDGVTNNNSL